MFFPHERHNKVWEQIMELYPITVTEDPVTSRTHPWQITPQWYTSPVTGKSYWRGKVEAGMVNGQPPKISMQFGDAPPEATERIIKEIAGKKKKPNPSDKHDVFLDEQAALSFLWRRVGKGADPEGFVANTSTGQVMGVYEKVPDFFKRLGAKDENPNPFAFELDENVRYLAAGDIALFQPRVRMVNNVTTGAVLDGVIVSVNPSFMVPKDFGPSVVAMTKFIRPENKDPTPQDIFFNRFVDDDFDLVHLARIYALSPPNYESQNIDQNWNLYLQYFCHFNLAFANANPEPRKEFEPLKIFTGLAGGIGDFVMNTFLAQNNDFSQAAIDFYRQRKLGGFFYAV